MSPDALSKENRATRFRNACFFAVDRLVQGRTAIVIAHRLATVQRADQIMILEHGQIREYGSRAALAGDPDSHYYGLLRTGLEEVLA